MNYTEEQLLAINKDNTNIIVSAGAGSGKTAVLTKRVIRKLESGIHINELLILTFTNKAADEMKAKIRKNIKDNLDLKDEVTLLDSAYITTFDSYALSVVRKYHYLLNLPHDIKIGDKLLLILKKKEFLDNIFLEYYEKEDKLFLNLIDNFCLKDDKILKDNLLKTNDKLDMLSDKQRYLDNYNAFSNIDDSISDYVNLIKNKINKIKDNIELIKYYTSEDYSTKLEDTLVNLLNSNTYDNIKINTNIKLPNLDKNSSNEAKKIKEDIKKEIDEIKKLTEYDNINQIKEDILSTKNNIKIIIDILKQLDIKIKNYKRDNNIYEFNDIILMAISLVRDNPNVRLELKDTYREILIDEYQDTNDLQEEFISLIANNNVYMVGDIKQAIYRFRNANPYIFKEKYNSYQDSKNGYKIDLNKNFRSRSEVLEDINLIFNKLMDETFGGANYLTMHQMIYGNKAYDLNKNPKQNNNLEILTYDENSKFSKLEIEAFIIANDIKTKIENKYMVYDNVLREAKYSDFVILLSDSKAFDLYKKVFEYFKIPLSILKDEKLALDINVIKNIINLIIKVKNNEIDQEFKLNFMSVARSFLYEMDDNLIFDYFVNDNFKDSDIYLKIKKIASNIDNMSLEEVLNTIIEEFNYYEKLIRIGSINNNLIEIDKIFEIALSLQEVGYNLYDFNEYLKNINKLDCDIEYKINEKEEDSVKILTIHKSKGLEYQICYFANLDKNFNLSDLKEDILYDNKYGIIIPSFNDNKKDTIYKSLVKDNYKKEEISERIRLFYVALTRAREKMIMVMKTPVKTITNKDNFNSFKDMLDYLDNSLISYKSEINLDNLKLTHDYLKKQQLKIGNISNLSSINVEQLNIENTYEQELSFSKKTHDLIDNKTYNNMKKGEYLHEVFERFDFKNKSYNNLNKFEIDKINNFLNQDLLKNIDKANIYPEYEFIYHDNNTLYHGIIDLMLEYNDYIDIIDYKLNDITDSNYLKQLKGYKNYIEKLTKKNVNIYLYSIIQDKIIDLEIKQK